MASQTPRTRLDPSLLHTFAAVADAGTISAAARVLHLSQPAVTAQIRRLEHELHTSLFVRSVRGVTLTPPGTQLLGYARRIHALVDEATGIVNPDDSALTGDLALAASTTIAAHVLMTPLAAFRRAYPAVPIRVEVGNTAQVIEWLAAGTLPLGLIEGHARASGLRLEPFVLDELVPVRAPHGPRVSKLQDLREVPWIVRETGSGTRDVVERALTRAGLKRPARGDDLELGSTEAIKSGVLAGLGVAFLSRWSFVDELADERIVVIEIPGLEIRRKFHWAFPSGAVRGTAARFVAVARRHPPTLQLRRR